MTAPDDLPDDDAVAMDFALGTLGGDDLRAAELRLRRDPAFAADVARWQALLTPLLDDVAPVAPPATTWATVERELFRTPDRDAVAPRPLVAGVAAWWRGLAVAAGAVAAVLAVLLARPTLPPAAPPRLLAAAMASTDPAKAILITATYDPARGTVILAPAKDASRGLTPELWMIAGTAKPVSLGVIDLHAPAAHRVPVALRRQLAGGVTLAISLEPAGGSPTGQPTGPVVATGTLAAI